METDALFEGLRNLPPPALDPTRAAEVQRRARAAFARARTGTTPGRARQAARRIGVPLLVTSAVASYLVWLVAFLAALGG